MYLKFTRPYLLFDILKQDWKYTAVFENWVTIPVINMTDGLLIELWYTMTEGLEIQDLDF
jgi:hypothetical protein